MTTSRVCVRVGRAAVGGPAGVADGEPAGDGALAQDALQHLHAAGRAPHVESAALAQHRDAGRVVPAVLELLQALDDDGDGVLLTDVPDDSAHGSAFLLLLGLLLVHGAPARG